MCSWQLDIRTEFVLAVLQCFVLPYALDVCKKYTIMCLKFNMQHSTDHIVCVNTTTHYFASNWMLLSTNKSFIK